MAKFANDTLIQVAGFDGQILAQEMVYDQKDFWNMTWSTKVGSTVTAVDLTDVDISAQIIRRQISDIVDGRYGLEFQIADYPPYVESATSTTVNPQGVDTGSNEFVALNATDLIVGDAIQFTGTIFGGVNTSTVYYVASQTGSDRFSISLTYGGSVITLTSGSGSMGVNTIVMGPTPVDLPITNRIDDQGKFTLVINDDVWGVMASDPELNINATDPVAFSGRIKLSFPSVGSTPAYDEQIFLLFLIRSDGVVN